MFEIYIIVQYSNVTCIAYFRLLCFWVQSRVYLYCCSAGFSSTL